MKRTQMVENLFFPLHDLCAQAVAEGVFPGAAIGVVHNESATKKQHLFTFGSTDYTRHTKVDTHTFYDLASLTKPLVTSLCILNLLKNKIVTMDDDLSSLLEVEIDSDKRKISLFNLLNHSSGLLPYSRFFIELTPYELLQRKEIIKKLIISSELAAGVGTKQIYSDLGYILLGLIIEIKTGCPLNTYVEEVIYKPLGLRLEKNLHFSGRAASPAAVRYAPTEECAWRKRVIQGEVGDENSFALGGITGHAGLFGNIRGVLDLVTFLLDMVKGRRGHPQIDTPDLRRAVTRQSDQGTWGLGFDTPSREGSSSGSYFSESSFGHLGFTGTSFWVDPVKDLGIVLLTNRVHPDRNNTKIKAFRPLFHDTVMELLGRG